ncbi:uncharacterized protein DUF547 [Vibrio maritimus]|uniref:Uncharacterized protein DUF547 n=1 Tax=Vibrio maritimus TaxID=990268 RepID=A0A090RYE0_9VIBR|nr:uncharacterized protein DUF547 [Vibrio maritimus]
MLRVLSLVFLMFATSAFSAPRSELWSYWDKSNDSNTQSVSHQAWQSFLDRYLVTEGENT